MFYFAWVDAEDGAFEAGFEREDEKVFRFEIRHGEGEVAQLSIDIENPRVGLLGAGRKQWAWLAHDDGTSDGVTPLFFGRLVGVPDGLQNEVVRLTFLAKPADFDAQKEALAATLRVAPFYDPIWINADKRADPDSVLEGYAGLWHVDRVSHVVSLSSHLAGEDGVNDFSADFFYDSLDVAHGAPGARSIKVEAQVFWDQEAKGEVDLSDALIDAFAAAGTATPRAISTMTGEGLMRDWPEKGDAIGAGWAVGTSSVVRTDGWVIPQDYVQTIVANGRIRFPVWTMRPEFFAAHDVSRARSEKLTFTLETDIQSILTEPGEDEVLLLTLSTQDVGAPVDPADTDNPLGALPIRDVRNRAYFTTDRGRDSVEALIAIARARLLIRARTVTVTFQAPFETVMGLSCRMNARVDDARLPGATATGKIIAYAFGCDGDAGAMSASVSIGCSIGNGATVSETAGTPVYVNDGYVNDGYQLRAGQTFMPIAGEVTYTEFGGTLPDDDGVDFFNLSAANVINSLVIINGMSDQSALLASYLSMGVADMAHAVNALNAIHTEIDLDLKPLTGGPFATEYPLTVSLLMTPKTIDLEAS